MMGLSCGQWCVTKWKITRSEQDVLDTRADFGDLRAPRVVRGVYHRRTNIGHINNPVIRLFCHASWHDGTVWTRLGEHPLGAPWAGACFGFRIVEVVAPR